MKYLDKLLTDLDNPRKYVPSVDTALDYQNLPSCSREKYVYYWLTPWYILPAYLRVNLDGLDFKDSEWNKLDKFLKKEYPIQRFLRDGYRDTAIYQVIRHVQWDLEEFYHDIKFWLFPRRADLKAAIPNGWADLSTIYENVLFAGIIDFVENEKGLERVLWVDNQPGTKNVAAKRKIKEIYQWAKTGRKELEEEISKSYPPLNHKMPYKEAYGELNRLEKKLEAQDTRYLTWIITNRQLLWT